MTKKYGGIQVRVNEETAQRLYALKAKTHKPIVWIIAEAIALLEKTGGQK